MAILPQETNLERCRPLEITLIQSELMIDMKSDHLLPNTLQVLCSANVGFPSVI